MSGEHWHLYTEPPDTERVVMLRFSATDETVVLRGFYSQHFSAYATSERNAKQLMFVHPTHWRELTEVEQ